MHSSVCVALSASWQAASTRNGYRQALNTEFARFALTRFAVTESPARVEFPTAARGCVRVRRRARRRGKLSRHRSSSGPPAMPPTQ